MKEAISDTLQDLLLNNKRIGFDDMGFGFRLGYEGLTVCDAYDCLMFARAVKTPAEITLIKRATQLNEKAILRTIDSWKPGKTWQDLDISYTRNVTDLGGFVRDPGGMIWGHPHGDDQALMLNAGLDNSVIHEGTHVMFDCHGSLNLYCWDGGKTWVAGGSLSKTAKKIANATAKVASEVINAMKPGVRIGELQALGRDAYRKAGVQLPDNAIIFFHGLGLSHMDIETYLPNGEPNTDWMLEENMVVPLHLLYPGGENERLWLEEVVLIKVDGGEPLFSWGFDPLESK